jgi:homoserine kinase
MTRVRVPASSANLGPGFDSFAVALGLWLELEVSPAGEFSLESDLPLPADRTNLVVRAFERVRPADGLRFSVRSEIPLSGGLGSSAAAIVAGLLAAGAGDDLLALATELEGHPDNVAAAIYGGAVIVADGRAHRFGAPAGLAAVLVVPHDGVPTAAARAALPTRVSLADAVFNTAHGALLAAGLVTGDHGLIAAGLADRLHQPYRSSLYPRSAELLGRATELGAIGATISGAGPAVLFWVESDAADGLEARLARDTAAWATTIRAAFSDAGGSLARGEP